MVVGHPGLGDKLNGAKQSTGELARVGEDAWFEGGHVLADAIALLALAQVDNDGLLVVFLLFGLEDVRGWFASHGAQEGIAA